MMTKERRTKRTQMGVLVLWAGVAGAYLTAPAHAGEVSFTFGGTVTVQSIFSDPPWNTVQVGDSWEITYTFESTTPNLGNPAFAIYFAITSYRLTIGSAGVSDSGSPGPPSISIFNGDAHSSGADQYEVNIDVQGGWDWFMQLDDITGTAWNNPLLAPREALRLCGDIPLPLATYFSRHDFRLDNSLNPQAGWMGGSVDYLRCCIDTDSDGFGFPGDPSCPNGGLEDCNDADSNVFPGNTETCDDTVDNDCNGQADCDDSACDRHEACGQCPFLLTLDGARNRKRNLGALYELRDDVLAANAEGRQYVDLFYRHAPELSLILLRDRALRTEVQAMIERFIPDLELALDGAEVMLSIADLRDIDKVLSKLGRQAQPGLRQDLRDLQVDLRKGYLTNLVGIHVESRGIRRR